MIDVVHRTGVSSTAHSESPLCGVISPSHLDFLKYHCAFLHGEVLCEFTPLLGMILSQSQSVLTLPNYWNIHLTHHMEDV
jgi:hypothetical protein